MSAMSTAREALGERFMSKFVVHPHTGCWLWLAGRNSHGYGNYIHGGRQCKAHRVAYEAVFGPIPQGLVMDHYACDVRHCVNPEHVRPVTVRENTLRGAGPTSDHLGRTACPKGHPLSGENLCVRPDGRRRCRECHRIEQRKVS